MKDNKYINLLLKKWQGKSDDNDHQELDTWLKESKDNAAFAKETKHAWDQSADYKQDFTPNVEAGLSKLKARISADQSVPQKQVQQLHPRRRWLQIAAAITLLITAGFLVQNFLTDSTNWQTDKTAIGETKSITLSDGTTIVLNEGSTLKYPETLQGKERRVELNGEAFFDVTRNEAMPFVIETKHTTINVLGTSFNVNAFLDKAITEVQVKTGKVSFSPKGSEKALTLTANQKGTFNHQTRALKPETDNTLNALAWYSKKLSFKKTPLSKVLMDLENYFKVDINLKDSRMGQCEYTSLFNNPDLEAMLQTLAVAFDLHLKQLNDTTYELQGGHCN